MGNKLPFMQWYPGDWIQDTRHLSPAAKGVWIDLINFMWLAPTRGTYRKPLELACRELGLTIINFLELVPQLKTVASVTVRNEAVTVASRRMLRDERARQLNRIRVTRYRSHAHVMGDVRNGNAGEVRSQKSEVPPNPHKVGEHLASQGANITPRAAGTNPRALAKRQVQEQAKARQYKDPVIDPAEQMDPEEMARIKDANFKASRDAKKSESVSGTETK